ncbi:hypothetical protein BABINDRAFT_161766 [Babjeviella inositovora NRRL Y-12698]|uniref:Uncharacterized protein n=1 Tax=Babjeviella inositovora NRRL Y-12698 TaxID=984486 RepID=A0A1E3QNY5_9ASCO|nr:uncharacterized protein BABINDRAFT_161766 [Babjeviella inositovora NRRL Y-12698]ODQ79360.1 hypothetical protein BABINDRAFT_161766 [Babjeviella inositovora NRRL Y-12698]
MAPVGCPGRMFPPQPLSYPHVMVLWVCVYRVASRPKPFNLYLRTLPSDVDIHQKVIICLYSAILHI